MLDFADIGGQYDDSSLGCQRENVERLNKFLADTPRPAIEFGGAFSDRYGGRLPSAAHFDGTIKIPKGKPVIFDGGNCVLRWHGIHSTIPSVDVGPGGAGIERKIRDLEIHSSGSGVRLDAPGRGTVVRDVRILPKCQGPRELDFRGFDDRATAGYGLQVVDGPDSNTSDGVTIDNVQIFESGGHGFYVVGQLNAGYIRGRVHGSAGTGFKAERLNGVLIDVVTESNHGWAWHLDRCGLGTIEPGGVSGASCDYGSVATFWCENNNWRGSPHASQGHGCRQFRLTGSTGLLIGGHNGYASNKADIDAGSRASCRFDYGRVWPIMAPLAEMEKTDVWGPLPTYPHDTSKARNNNFALAWPDEKYRPKLERTGLAWELRIPPYCFDQARGTFAYWRPWGLIALFTSQPGDMVFYHVKISGDERLRDWCIGRESGPHPVQASDCCNFHITGPKGLGNTWPGIYDTEPHDFSGHASINAERSDIGPAITVWSKGMEDRTGMFPQHHEMILRIHSWRFWLVRG